MTQQDVVINLFAFGIVNFRKLCSVANTLQECCFTSIRPADYEDSEVTYAIEVLFHFCMIQLDFSSRTFCDHVGIRPWIKVLFDFRGIQLDLSRRIFCDRVIDIITCSLSSL